MIDVPIAYSHASQIIVDQYNASEKTEESPEFWNADEAASVKAEIKVYYRTKQNFRCSYCNQRLRVRHGRAWDTEHIISRQAYPEFMFLPKNLCISCLDCNGHKSQKNVLTNNLVQRYPRASTGFLIIHPHFDNYDEHIKVIGDKYYAPHSPKGGFTIDCCNLYRFAGESLGYDNTLINNSQAFEAMNELMQREIDEETEIKIKVTKAGQIEIEYTIKI